MNITRSINAPVRGLATISWGNTTYDETYTVLKWGVNPYPPTTKVVKAISQSLTTLNHYPSLMDELKSALGQYTGCDVDQICLVNGSDKAFRLIAEVCMKQGDVALSFAPSYPVFDESIRVVGGIVTKIPLTQDFMIPPIKIVKTYLTKKTKLIYVCNPNNPTGNHIASNEDIEQLLNLNIIVIVDEAYFEFAGHTATSLLEKYNNLIILRSFSKTFGLAGLRVGYTLSSPEMTGYLIRVENSLEIFNISTPSLAGALSALVNINDMRNAIQKMQKTKEILTRELTKCCLIVYPSYTSFVMLSLQKVGIKSTDFVQAMAAEKIIMKDMSIYSGLSEYSVYMGIPRSDQVDSVLKIMIKVITNLQSKADATNL